jgi:hypothetical protein
MFGDLSIVIPWRAGTDPWRLKSFDWILNRYQLLYPEAELILADDGSEEFNRATFINAGATEASREFLLIADADTISFPEFIRGGLAKMKAGAPWVIPYGDQDYYNSDQASAEWILGRDTMENISPSQITWEHKLKSWSGQVLIRTEDFESVGGFDPRFGSGTAIGFGDDTLFGHQVRRQFGDVAIYSGTPIVHHPDTSRLTRESLLTRTRLGAISELWIAAALGKPIPYQATRPALINRLIFATKALRSRLLHNGSPLTQDELYGYYSLVMSLEADAYTDAKRALGMAA